MSKANEAAFPSSIKPELRAEVGDGLTKREYFAGQAMQGILSSAPIDELQRLPGPKAGSTLAGWVARNAALSADALIAELEEKP